jgi:hypothetical protein
MKKNHTYGKTCEEKKKNPRESDGEVNHDENR